jgi:CBS domain-containing protein
MPHSCPTEQPKAPDAGACCPAKSKRCAKDFFDLSVPRLGPDSLVSHALKSLFLSGLTAVPAAQNHDNLRVSLFRGEFRAHRMLREIFPLLNSKDIFPEIEKLLCLPAGPFIVRPAGVVESSDESEKILSTMAASEGLMVNVVDGNYLLGTITSRIVLEWIAGFGPNNQTLPENYAQGSIEAAILRLFKMPIGQVVAQDGANAEIICLEAEDDLSKAVWIFNSAGKDFLPVLRRSGQLIGVLRTNGILFCLPPISSLISSAQFRPISVVGRLPVAEMIDSRPELIPQDASVLEAAIRMNQSNSLCLGMVNASRDFCGIFSFRDLLKGLLAQCRG